MNKIIDLNRQNIQTAISDYRRHTRMTAVLDDVSDAFVDRLAEDSAYAKRDLRDIFSHSNAWNNDLQAIVINGTKTHNPNYALVRSLAETILNPATLNFKLEKRALVDRAIGFFASPDDYNADCVAAIQELAPRAYAPNKKKSRVFKALCSALGVADEAKGSPFQKFFAQLADELNGKQHDFKLFMSINPAHFITMSNPKDDRRGCTLTSCHSFNATDYEYNCGCTGYARDKVTFIVFTAADPDIAETLNNRKTSRQIFAYKPYNGLLLQSRLYNTHGGTHGEQEDSKLYLDIVQREISLLEEVPNVWHSETYFNNSRRIYIDSGYGYGGYEDWTFSEFGATISINDSHLDDFRTFTVGVYGLCICCGEEISENLYCEDCDPADCEICDECGCRCDGTTNVINEYGDRVNVCDTCLEDGYQFCCHCDEYYPRGDMTRVDSTYVCPNCLEEYCCECSECGELHHQSNMQHAYNQYGNEVMVCDDCRHDYYEWCRHCGECCHDETMHSVRGHYGAEIRVCDDCLNNYYSECENCGECFNTSDLTNGLCADCRRNEEDE